MLEGMRVIEMAYFYPGPYCTQMLAELGAEVIKVEPPDGDPIRYRREIFAALNRNKRSLVLNLKEEEDRQKFLELVAEADVVVEGFRPGVAAKLGVDYEAARKVNPSIIYCSISGMGQNPKINAPVHDINVISMAGICEIAGTKLGRPYDPNVQISDFSSAVFATIAILAAYVRKLKTGEGCYIDVSMLGTVLAAIPVHSSRLLNGMEIAEDFVANPGYEIYRAKDGYISFGILNEPHSWKRLCEALGLDYGDMSFEERVERREEIRRAIAERVGELETKELQRLLGEKVPFGIVSSMENVRDLADEELFATAEFDRSYTVVGFPAIFSNFRPKRSGKVPRLGEG